MALVEPISHNRAATRFGRSTNLLVQLAIAEAR